MRERLTTTSYAVLAQVAVRPWSAYELAEQRVRYFRYVWPRAESAIYREVKRLSKMDLLVGTKEFTGKRSRTIYAITETGREALREWLSTPVSPFSMEFEALLRVFVAPLGTKDDLTQTLEQVRTDVREMLLFAGEVKEEFIEGINVAQHDIHLRALGVDFFVSLLRTVEAWIERTLDVVSSWDDLEPSAEKSRQALEAIRAVPVRTPDEALAAVARPPAGQLRGRS